MIEQVSRWRTTDGTLFIDKDKATIYDAEMKLRQDLETTILGIRPVTVDKIINKPTMIVDIINAYIKSVEIAKAIKSPESQ